MQIVKIESGQVIGERPGGFYTMTISVYGEEFQVPIGGETFRTLSELVDAVAEVASGREEVVPAADMLPVQQEQTLPPSPQDDPLCATNLASNLESVGLFDGPSQSGIGFQPAGILDFNVTQSDELEDTAVEDESDDPGEVYEEDLEQA